MSSVTASHKPHAVLIPFPAQGHVNPFIQLAKVLLDRGFFVTFVNTEHNHKRLLKSRGPNSLDGLPDFRFQTIPDGLPPISADSTHHLPTLCDSTAKNCLAPFCDLITKLNDPSSSSDPPVTSIVADGVMCFALDAADKFGLPIALFWTTSACGFLAYRHFRNLIQRNIIPLPGNDLLKMSIKMLVNESR